MLLHPAAEEELPAIAALMNRAYRSGGEVDSWCSETAYVAGERTSAALLAADRAERPHASLLVSRLEGAVVACVWLEPQGDGTVVYLGSLAVDPALQNRGAGRAMLDACEARASASGAGVVRMTVVDVRETLIDWYLRRGYRLTGATEPWPYGDDRFGRPLREDLRFVVLEKTLAG